LLLAAILILSAASHAAGRTVVVTMNAMKGTGENGTATFTEQGDKTLIAGDVQNGTAAHQLSHLHAGSCDDYTPRPAYPLADVVSGKSHTIVNERFDKLVSGAYVLNVHKSYDDIAPQASCGSVKR
jgi:hypothetical protein